MLTSAPVANPAPALQPKKTASATAPAMATPAAPVTVPRMICACSLNSETGEDARVCLLSAKSGSSYHGSKKSVKRFAPPAALAD